MRSLNERPDVQEKIRAHLVSDSNPFRGETGDEIRARCTETHRAMGFPNLNRGNGHGPTEPQALLADLLGRGWKMELSIRTGMRRGCGWPTAYKVDIGHPLLKIAIECDGHSHRTKRIKEVDARQDELLTSKGWIVLRFWNREILEETERVLAEIRSSISRRRAGTTSPVGSSSTTATTLQPSPTPT